MTNAINFNWFYHNNCPEFQDIKDRIWQFNNPTEKQLAEWRREHFTGEKEHVFGWVHVLEDIKEIKEEFERDGPRLDGGKYEWMNFAEFAFDMMYQDGNCAPWLKG